MPDVYERDLFAQNIAALPPDDIGKRNISELVEFITLFRTNILSADIEALFPDLYNEHFDRTEAISMYRRFSGEAKTVLDRYPHLVEVL